MFGGEASDKKVKVLSGGEKTRLAMIRLLLEPVNLLILDEPTNHLDMRTKDILKQAIKDFNGTVIVVSHDRQFLDGLVEKVYEFGGGKVRECLGGIYEFLEKKKLDSLTDLERSTSLRDDTKKKTATTETPPADKKEQQRRTYTEQREYEKTQRRLRKKVEELEAEVSRLEEEKAAIEARFADGETSDDLYAAHSKAQKDLEIAMSYWEEASEELEKYGQ